jgi:hypothetical protein
LLLAAIVLVDSAATYHGVVIGRRLRRPLAGGILLILLGTVVAGCVRYRTPSEHALWEATRDARGKAERARQELEGALRSGPAEDAAAALELGRAEFQETVGSDGRSSLLGSGSRPDGSVQFDLAIVGGAETGGGFTGATAGVLLCARVTTTLGRDARAASPTCPARPA